MRSPRISATRIVLLLPLIVLAMALAGCSTTNGPGASADIQAARPVAAAGTYIVQRGDTIYGIARQLNVSVRTLIDANNLQPPFQVSPGQVLVLSAAGSYVVVREDTLLGVARKTGVSFSTLARINNLSPPYLLRIGQTLKLPGANGDSTAVAAAAPPSADALRPVAVAAPVALPPPADRAQGGYSSLSERESRVAAIPPPPPPPSSSAPSAAPSAAAPQPAPAGAAPAASGVAAAPSPPPAEQHASAAPLPPAPPASGRGFIWPVRGPLLAEFGTTGKGQHNDGINIAVPRGTAVVAAQDGVVAYSGNELRGFGNLLLIKHADGWMTAYAHNDTLLVKRGDTVKRGQQIAKSGDSGGVAQPQLHFEVRQGTRAVDPLGVLGGKATPATSSIDSSDPS